MDITSLDYFLIIRDILQMVIAAILVRILLQKLGQSWIVTTAHTATLVFLPSLTYLITKVISGNIALSLGMVGALSIVRFRNPVRSPLELTVYFGAITMGIAVSVNPNWLAILLIAITMSTAILVFTNFLYLKIFKTSFFKTSFAEGNSLSTLNVLSSERILLLNEHNYLSSINYQDGQYGYLLISNDASNLQMVLDQIQHDTSIISFQLKK